MEYNKKHGITTQTIVKAITDIAQTTHKPKRRYKKEDIPPEERERLIHELIQQMEMASNNLEFEKATELRDQIEGLKEK